MRSFFLRGHLALLALLLMAVPAIATSDPFLVVFPVGDVVELPRPEGAISLAHEEPEVVKRIFAQQHDFGYFLVDALAWADFLPAEESVQGSPFFDGILLRIDNELAGHTSAEDFERLAARVASERGRDVSELVQVLVPTQTEMEESIERVPLGPAEIEAGPVEQVEARIEYGEIFDRGAGHLSGFTVVVADGREQDRFFVGTTTLIHLQSFPLEILILSEVRSQDEAEEAFEFMQRFTDEWIGRVSSESKKRLPSIDLDTLKRFRSPVYLFKAAGKMAWVVIGSCALALTLILGVPGRRSRLRDSLALLPILVGAVLLPYAFAQGRSVHLHYVGPFRPGFALDFISIIWTESLALPILGALSTVFAIAVVSWARQRSGIETEPNEAPSPDVD